MDDALLQGLPKVELHAHISGSVTQDKLRTMAAARGARFEQFDVREVRADPEASGGCSTSPAAPLSPAAVKAQHDRRMAHGFSYFETVGKVITDLESLREATAHVLEEFASKDHCVYLELRSAPKAFRGSSAADYVRVVRQCAQEVADRMLVKLLLSLNRGTIRSRADADRQVAGAYALAAQFPDFVVGLDVSGDPAADSVVPFLLPALLEHEDKIGRKRRRTEQHEEDRHDRSSSLLPISWHLGERVDHADTEVDAVLDQVDALRIRRLGHVCFLSDRQRQRVLSLADRVSVELCPTSNLVTKCLPLLEDHHFPQYYGKCKVALCTDDAGLFCCTLTSELRDMARAFALSAEELVRLQLDALEASFLGAAEKATVLCRLRRQRGHGASPSEANP